MATKTPSRGNVSTQAGRRGIGGLLRSVAGNPDAFGSERSFSPEIGSNWKAEGPVGGYYIDFGFKAESSEWPPYWLAPRREQLHVATIQWGLGAFERYVGGEGEEWLAAARAAADHLVETQHRGGPQHGGWRHFFPMPHTYEIKPPWLSGIAQGEGASLLVRLYLETGEERFAEAARAALAPMSIPVADGGMAADLEGAPFVEEYPTEPGSYVLNGAIFALWGYRDVGVALEDPESLARFELLTSALANRLGHWDTGFWSRYDLYPHPVANIATPAYHLLHIRQLEVLDALSSRPPFRQVKSRFQDYRGSFACRRKAIGRKVAFRLLVPRNAALAHRLPWSTQGEDKDDDTLVLCYHAVSDEWNSTLAVRSGRLEAQLDHLVGLGYRSVTFTEAVIGPSHGKRVAITFDDGYLSVLERAKPLLDERGMVATVFVPTDHVGRAEPMGWPGIDEWSDGPHAPELTPLTWAQAGSLVKSGWEIGSHTCSHPRLTTLDDGELARQMTESREECERQLGRPCTSMAYPYGEVDERVSEAAMVAGYSAAAALSPTDRPSPFRWPRVGVYDVDDDRVFRLKVSRPMRRLQRSHAWGAIHAAASPLRPRDHAVS